VVTTRRAPIGSVGRFAPSPTGDLHLGNLRTALVAWLSARAVAGRFIVRLEDLDRMTSSGVHERAQLAALEWLGLDWDGDVVRQSDRFDLHRSVLDDLRAQGLLYPCYCTRREIREAVHAPHGEPVDGSYPGVCRRLSGRARRAHEAMGRRPAWRLRSTNETVSVSDLVLGPLEGRADDVVVERNDGVPAYHLAVVVDDDLQGVGQVVRGDDLATATPRQVYLQRLIGASTPAYAHIPLVVGADGQRLAKRHGAVTAGELRADGHDARAVVGRMAVSLGWRDRPDPVTPAELLVDFSLPAPGNPWMITTDLTRWRDVTHRGGPPLSGHR
jgi:glutamyl-tRNA synthetase